MFQLTLSPLEIQTRQMFNAVFVNEDNWTPGRSAVAQVMVNEWANAIPADKVLAVVAARFSFVEGPELGEAVRKALSFFVRQNVLRTRRSQGKTLYEVNFS